MRDHHSIARTVLTLGDVQKDPSLLGGVRLAFTVDLRRQVSHLAAEIDGAFFSAVVEAQRRDPRPEARPTSSSPPTQRRNASVSQSGGCWIMLTTYPA
jgi:hypothetical protein